MQSNGRRETSGDRRRTDGLATQDGKMLAAL
jgi:hypothetical protein